MNSLFIVFIITLPAILKAVPLQPNWYQAEKQCANKHSRLPKLDDIKISDIERIFGKDRKIWLGGKFVNTQWKWIDDGPLYDHVGCFDIPLDQLTPRNEACLEVVDCFRVCKTPYIALQTNHCYCFSNISGYQNRSSSDCHYHCWNNFEESCGGLSALSVYHGDTTLFPWSQNSNTLLDDCAFLNRPLSISVSMETDMCDAQSVLRKPFFGQTCKTCQPQRVDIYLTWEKAKHFHNFSVARVTRADNPPFHAGVHGPQYYWIGLHKHHSLWKWTDNSRVIQTSFNGSQDSNVTKCLAGLRGTNGNVVMMSLPCSTNLQSVCISAKSSADNAHTDVTSATSYTILTAKLPQEKSTDEYRDLYIALAVIGGLALIAICVITTVCIIRRKRRQNRTMLYNVNVPVSDISDAWTNNSQLIIMDNSIYGKTQKRVRIRSLRDLIYSSQGKTSSLHSLVQSGDNSERQMNGAASQSLRASSGLPDPVRPFPFEPEKRGDK
ncbi:uncharacterized protein LOC121385127 [Gigantopelta aegis]|uniref:uncharacterized protein LOC121385127 n=1 Tax=Gigantopelta aegis TaxID=1735272 RepID=UPI001B887ECD|nr:uncharacterized protein LOC121385127 [Gigantopelta aegis]